MRPRRWVWRRWIFYVWTVIGCFMAVVWALAAHSGLQAGTRNSGYGFLLARSRADYGPDEGLPSIMGPALAIGGPFCCFSWCCGPESRSELQKRIMIPSGAFEARLYYCGGYLGRTA